MWNGKKSLLAAGGLLVLLLTGTGVVVKVNADQKAEAEQAAAAAVAVADQTRIEAEARAAHEAEIREMTAAIEAAQVEKARLEAEEKARVAAEEKARVEAEEKAKALAEAEAQAEATASAQEQGQQPSQQTGQGAGQQTTASANTSSAPVAQPKPRRAPRTIQCSYTGEYQVGYANARTLTVTAPVPPHTTAVLTAKGMSGLTGLGQHTAGAGGTVTWNVFFEPSLSGNVNLIVETSDGKKQMVQCSVIALDTTKYSDWQ